MKTVTKAQFAKGTACSLFYSTLFFAFLFISSTPLKAQHRPELWGVTDNGGANDVGYIFKYDVDANRMSQVASLNRYHLPQTYFSEFFPAEDGQLYAIKSISDSVDKAAIFCWNPQTNTLEKRYSFDPSFYSKVSGTLTAYNGKFYGLAWAGAKTGSPYSYVNGIIFEWNPATNTLTNQYYFEPLAAGKQGEYPRGSLTLYNNKLYGTTTYGGANSAGVLFEWDPSGKRFLKKVDFSTAVTGSYPVSHLYLFDEKLYSSTTQGGAFGKGALTEFDPNTSTLRKVLDHRLKPGADRMALKDGKLYSASEAELSILEIHIQTATVWSYPTFFNRDISTPVSALTLLGDTFYGVSYDHTYPQTKVDTSYIYQWVPGLRTLNRIAAFTPGEMGKDVSALYHLNGKLYGITDNGSRGGRGAIFEVDPSAKTIVKRKDFEGAHDGRQGNSLLFYKGLFYGSTMRGGAFDAGTLFSFNPDDLQYNKLFDFEPHNGEMPYANLAAHNQKLYGLTIGGGTDEYGYDAYYGGVLFEWDPQEAGFTKKVDLPRERSSFSARHGRSAFTALNNRLYVVRKETEVLPAGIFEYNPATNQFTSIFSFSESFKIWSENGVTAHDGKLVGFAWWQDEWSAKEVIYEFNPSTNAFSYRLVPFNYSKFPYPSGLTGAPVFLGDKWYCLTTQGCFNRGSMMEWDPVADTVAAYCIENTLSAGHVLGKLTVVDTLLFGLTEKGIFQFNTKTKSFREVVSYTNPVFNTGTHRLLAFRLSNANPSISGTAEQITLCLTDTPGGALTFTAQDADGDALLVSVTSSDTTLIRQQALSLTSAGNNQYRLQFTAERKTGVATLTLKAADTFYGVQTIKVKVQIAEKPVAKLQLTDTACHNSTDRLLSGGSPAGGFYLVDGLHRDSLLFKTLGLGEHTIDYVYTNAAGCADTARHKLYIVPCADPSANTIDVVVYPNPSTGIVHIENKELLTAIVTVFNVHGGQVYSTVSSDQTITLNLSSLKPGMYFIRVTNKNGTATKRVEIVH